MKKFAVAFLILTLFVIIMAGPVQINGRVEFSYNISPNFSLSITNSMSNNTMYLVITSGGAVLVADVNYNDPNIVSAYVNEFFVPWKVNNNLTVFFGYRNVADYDSFLGNAGSFKWGKNGIGILWYKSVLSFIYGDKNLYLEGGTSFNADSTTPLNFAFLVKTSIANFNVSLNVKGTSDFSYGLLGARLSYQMKPFVLYLAGGYEYTDNELAGLLLGLTANLSNVGVLSEVDLSDFTNIKVYADANYKLSNYKLGVSGKYEFVNSRYNFEPYVATKLGNADGRLFGKFENTGFKGLTLNIAFGF